MPLGCFMAIVFDLQHYRSSSRSAPCRGRSREWRCRAALLIAYSFSFTDSFAYNQSAAFLNILKVKPPYSRISIRTSYSAKGNCFPNRTSRLPPEAYFMTKQEKGYEPRKKSQTRTVKSEKAVPLSKRGKFTKATYSQPKTSVSKQKRS